MPHTPLLQLGVPPLLDGDTLTLEARITRLRGPIGKADAIASVDGELACRAALTFALTELTA